MDPPAQVLLCRKRKREEDFYPSLVLEERPVKVSRKETDELAAAFGSILVSDESNQRTATNMGRKLFRYLGRKDELGNNMSTKVLELQQNKVLLQSDLVRLCL
eukprot:TRINITY_DN2461_c0_g2_i4.p1 TRINITY_DN2461_c0_g2~~TRINITY_DN2461_c0_g2_i4.p1  ORF type:complete len:103 (-),score=16.84 TRINITY_DN2461_c0_g2_i4:460-768(-)